MYVTSWPRRLPCVPWGRDGGMAAPWNAICVFSCLIVGIDRWIHLTNCWMFLLRPSINTSNIQPVGLTPNGIQNQMFILKHTDILVAILIGGRGFDWFNIRLSSHSFRWFVLLYTRDYIVMRLSHTSCSFNHTVWQLCHIDLNVWENTNAVHFSCDIRKYSTCPMYEVFA